MSELKPGWKRLKFGDMASCINDRVDNPSDAGVDRYVGLEHVEPNCLCIRRWGKVDEVESTKLRFRSGDIIFGKRRAYQRKVAVADFKGICSAHAMVLREKHVFLIPGFLPYFMLSNVFMARAIAISAGSLSPTISWKTLANEEFEIPGIAEQQRILHALRASDLMRSSVVELEIKAKQLAEALDEEFFSKAPSEWNRIPITSLCEMMSRRHGASDDQTNVNSSCSGAVPVLRSLNVWPGRFDLNDLRYISPEGNRAQAKLQLRANDVLIVRTGDSGRPGNAAVVPPEMEGWNCLDLILARPNKKILSRFLEAALNRPSSLQRLTTLAPGTKQKHLTMTELHRLLIPVPPIELQRQFLGQRAAIYRVAELCGQRRILAADVHGKLAQTLEVANVQ